ncbi:AAA family ATPase [Roseateles albus]|uniref:AAA family ATPase n=1 Tax=Roseateles albus TaxID=2987525 RepID=A0ABT5KHE0_9BURK|nr:AAA family ATPase [Roseateles albus]MDC8773351.1 AAA family ATPase [Roseateles albus]
MTLARTTQIWDSFVARWPIEALPTMTLDEYATAGNKDCFVYWLESMTDDLGSIWGGSAFKFGVYSRKDQSEKDSAGSAQYSGTHAWLRKYGNSAASAFELVRSIIVGVAQAARTGNLQAIDAADLGDAVKWKIAFLYQDRTAPTIMPVYKRQWLNQLSCMDAKTPCSAMHQKLMAQRGDVDLMQYGEQLWNQVLDAERETAPLSNDDALRYLQTCGQLEAIKPPTIAVAGFRCRNGQELALIRRREKPVLFLSPGDWEARVSRAALKHQAYGPEKNRSAGLAANAPSLDIPHHAVSVTVRNLAQLVELCEAYDEGVEYPMELLASTTLAVPVVTVEANRVELPLNQILYGPPGTGKTYGTIEAALEILDPLHLAAHRVDRAALKRRFDALAHEGRVQFVTFHQSFSYEDFVEGLRADTDAATGQLRYDVTDGVFKTICQTAAVKVTRSEAAPIDIKGRSIWKMSLGNAQSEADVFEECMTQNYALLGYGGGVDFGGCKTRQDVIDRFTSEGITFPNPGNEYSVTSVTNFVTKMKAGDLMVVSDGNLKFRAIGEVAGDYQFKKHQDYDDDFSQMRPMKWLRRYQPSLPHGEVLNSKFSQMTLYQLQPAVVNLEKLQALLGDVGAATKATPEAGAGAGFGPGQSNAARVLIIDEINRGNVSRIFGELITLIEPSKRAGADEALEAVLPYSKGRFSVPSNVYLIGTMNTADRSLTGMDVALRRRFVFKEMSPQPQLLAGIRVGGIAIDELLTVMNQRIEALLDRDHSLGHAYFMPLRATPTLAKLAEIFRHQVLPLLQEYFFEDWQRIQWVLNDHRKPEDFQFVSADPLESDALFGNEVNVSLKPQTWRVNEDAFRCEESYLGVIDHLDAAE